MLFLSSFIVQKKCIIINSDLVLSVCVSCHKTATCKQMHGRMQWWSACLTYIMPFDGRRYHHIWFYLVMHVFQRADTYIYIYKYVYTEVDSMCHVEFAMTTIKTTSIFVVPFCVSLNSTRSIFIGIISNHIFLSTLCTVLSRVQYFMDIWI